MAASDDARSECLDDEMVDAFLAGRLASDRADDVRSHLEACDECRSLVAALVRATTESTSDEEGSRTLGDERPCPSRTEPLASGRAGPPACATVGDVVADRYRLDRELGEGGSGVVWAATQLPEARRVALKILKLPGPDATTRFLREARVLANLSHPHVVEILEAFVIEGGAPAMAMELLEGEPLGRLLGRVGRLSVAETVRLLLPVVSAVGAAHAAGIVHRDIKPENVFLVRGEGRRAGVKVLDFGLAKLFASEGAVARTRSLTRPGSLLGTPHYMAPEQVWGARDVDHRVDVWALGVVLWECLVGERPIRGKTFGQVFKAITTAGVPRLDTRVGGLPPALVELVGRMTALDRDARPVDLREVFALLSTMPRA